MSGINDDHFFAADRRGKQGGGYGLRLWRRNRHGLLRLDGAACAYFPVKIDYKSRRVAELKSLEGGEISTGLNLQYFLVVGGFQCNGLNHSILKCCVLKSRRKILRTGNHGQNITLGLNL